MPAAVVGVLPVDKPIGPTSHDVVATARRALGTRRIGHTGTLDPFASGLLLLCVGGATRLAEYLTGLPKTYRAVIRFGVATDTDDRTGEPIATSDAWCDFTTQAVTDALSELTGEIDQVPPTFSAKKVQGVAMHRLARAGAAPASAAVRVQIHDMSLLHFEPPQAEIEVVCSAGTYVRAIARDVGSLLGCPAHLGELRRTRIGRHDVASAVATESLHDAEAVRQAWIDPLAAVAHLPRVDVDAETARLLEHGKAVPAHAELPQRIIVVASGNQLLAIAEAEDGMLRPRKVFTHG